MSNKTVGLPTYINWNLIKFKWSEPQDISYLDADDAELAEVGLDDVIAGDRGAVAVHLGRENRNMKTLIQAWKRRNHKRENNLRLIEFIKVETLWLTH